MPYKVIEEDGEFAVYKLDTEGEPTGKPIGTHNNKENANAQMRALYASENKAVKMADEGEDWIEGPGMPFGGPFNGQDIEGEHFSKDTNFAFDWFAERPLLYQHGLDKGTGMSVVGRVKSWAITDLGVWTKAQLDAQNEYFEAIRQLIQEGKLFFSSGAMRHLVEVNRKSGEIKRWPWVELSLTPTPANLEATVDMATAEKHFDAAGLKAEWKGLEIEGAEKALTVTASTGNMTSSNDSYTWSGDTETMTWHPDADEKKALRDSYEELLSKLSAAVNPPSPFGMHEAWTHIEATFPDHFIATRYEDGEETYWRVDYSLERGDVQLGMAQSVDKVFVGADKSIDAPLTIEADYATRNAKALTERTKGLHERRVDEGRVLSEVNRKRLSESRDALRIASDELDAIINTPTPEAKAERRRRAIANLRVLQLRV
jgi:hypothetical protein